MVDNRSYVYAYMRPNGTPYYIGQGIGRRATHRHAVSVPKDRNRIVYLYKHLSRKQALAIEIFWIAVYGREIEGGILLNITPGGDRGCLGYKHTQETKDKLSKANRGRIITEEHRKKLSISAVARGSNRTGSIMSDEAKRKLSDFQKSIPRIECKYCNKGIIQTQMPRHVKALHKENI